MSRHGSQSPSSEFTLELSASDADVDELGHVSNIAYVRWVQDAAVAHSASVGWDHAAYQRLGAIFVVRRHDIEYLRSAFAGDGIAVRTHVAWWRAAVSERATRIERVSDGTLLARAATQWALVNIESGRPTRIPQVLQDAFYPPDDAAGNA